MTQTTPEQLAEKLRTRFGERLASTLVSHGMPTVEVAPADLVAICTALRDEPDFHFEQLTDLCGVDFLGYGEAEIPLSDDATHEGFGRGVTGTTAPGRFGWDNRPQKPQYLRRFAAVIHLLSFEHNDRMRIRCFAPEDALPVLPTPISR